MVLADRLVVIENGSAVQEGPPAAVARRPRTDYVARLVGLNLHRGDAQGSRVHLAGGGQLIVAHPAYGPVFVAFPPNAVALHPNRPEGSPRNTWPARVEGIELHGDQVRVSLDGPIRAHADLTPAAVADLRLTPGAEVWAALKATETHAYPA
jgi:molybdate transport system ATP-binding protein